MRCINSILLLTIGFAVSGCKSPSFSSGCYALISYTISDEKIPAQLMGIYRRKTENAPVLRSQICIAGDRVMFYAFQFRSDSKLKEITITADGKNVLVYDAPGN